MDMELDDHSSISSDGSNDNYGNDADMNVQSSGGSDAGESSDAGSDNIDDGDEDTDISAAIPRTKQRSKRRRKTTKDKNDQSSNPLHILTEAEILLQSNLYRYQIEELLNEINVKCKIRVKILEWINNFKNLVSTWKPSKSFPLSTYAKVLGKIQLPFPSYIEPKGAEKSTFQWLPPESIREVGSFAMGTPVSKISAFDISLEMPPSLFHKSDMLNHVYHLKRSLYVAYVGKRLQNYGDDIKFTLLGGDPLKPGLEIYVKKKKLLHIRVHFVLPKNFGKFQISRLGPCRNSVRANYFLGTALEGEDTGPKTSSYNHSILEDLLFLVNNELTITILESAPAFCDAIKLLKVWLTQRSLNEGFGAFSNYIMTMFVIYLIKKGKINSKMSSYQIIRFVFVNLMQSDWSTNGITFDPLEKSILEEWHSSAEVVFLDPTARINFAANMSRFTFGRVKNEAKLAINSLNSSTTTSFQSMFISKTPFFLNFDHILQLRISDELKEKFKSEEKWNGQYLNFSGFGLPIAVRIIVPLVEKCLAQRAILTDFQLSPPTEWDLTQSSNYSTILRIGIIINRDFAFKVIEKADSEDPVIGKSFKEFWGNKSQLRRFMDGTMMESVSFEEDTEKDRVPFHMLQYILSTYLDITLSREADEYLDTQLDQLLEPELAMLKYIEPSVRKVPVSKDGPKKKKARFFLLAKKKEQKRRMTEAKRVQVDEVATLASRAFDDISKILRQLEGLPLNITAVQGTSEVLRFSSIYPTPPQRFTTSALLTEAIGTQLRIRETSESVPAGDVLSKVPKYIEPIGVVVQLESSGKWPDDLKAIDRLKCAFLIRIGQLLQEQIGLTVRFCPRHLYVLKDGFIFRIRLTYFRELTLLKQLRGDDGILRFRENVESLTLEKETLLLPQLTSTLHGFHRQFGAFGRTCRLAKRWIASHLLLGSSRNMDSHHRHHDGRFTEESIELLVASLFLQPSPFTCPPNEAQVGFLRFLNLLGNTDWKSTAFILNFNAKLNREEIQKIESEFVKRRDSLPLLFLATPEDKLGTVWTKHLSPPILLRGGVLAKFALDTILIDLGSIVEMESNGNLKTNWRKLFTPSIKVFDVIIWIKKEMIARKSPGFNDGSSTSSSQKLMFTEYAKSSTTDLIPIVDFDPVRLYYQELVETFGHLCNFVSDIYGGNCIALAWKPESTNSRKFEISQIRGRKLGKNGQSLILDIDGILEEMEFMGEGIVDHIELRRESPE